MTNSPGPSRRGFLLGLGAVGVAAGCGSSSSKIMSSDAAVKTVERDRARSGSGVFAHDLVLSPADVDLGGIVVNTWTFGGQPGAPELRMKAGDSVRVNVANQLSAATSIHWHGLSLRNDMDGVADITQPPIAAGGSFSYRFTAPTPGTFWYHPHMGLQLDRGLYAPFVIEDPDEPLDVDVDQVVILDDWLDDIAGGTPEAAFSSLSSMPGMNMGIGSMGLSGDHTSSLLGGDAGDISYPEHLLNGKVAFDRPTFDVPLNGRIRLRIINAGSDTAYRVAIEGHQMTVTHADGFPVEHVVVDALLLGMGERYDVMVAPTSGAWSLYAEAVGKDGSASAVIRTAGAEATKASPSTVRPKELDGKLLAYSDLVADESVRFAWSPDRTVDVELTGSMMKNDWTIDRRSFAQHEPIEVRSGEKVRLRIKNSTQMWHPMHLHGHTFRLGGSPSNPRKDTANVLPGKTMDFDLIADNPGQWMLHCHNTYHLESGMATVLSYMK